jgi:CubicO group peptidase (beta-lactamase class C family)
MKKMMILIMLAALPLAAAPLEVVKPEQVGFSSERLQRIHQAIQRHIDAGDISGAVTLVARKGQIAHFETHGLMDIETRKAMTKDAIFRIASMSKPITAVAILMLTEEGKFRLTDPVSKFIPEFKDMKVAVARESAAPPVAGVAGARGAAPPQFYTIPANREITIRDLLTHVSGLASGPMSNSEAAKLNPTPNAVLPLESLATYIPKLGTTPLEFQPGSRWSYSPLAGFDTLGRIVEVVSGQSLDEFLRQQVFEPLKMKDTFFWDEDRATRQATIYQKTNNGLRKLTDQLYSTKYFSGAGGLASTAEDYLQFGQMLLNGGQLSGKRLLSPRTVELMSSVHVPDTLPGRQAGVGFGLGVQVASDPVRANLFQSNGSYGWDGAYGTHFWVDPKEEIVGILMIQSTGANAGQIWRDYETAVMQAIVE